MKLADLLLQNKSIIVERWIDLLFRSYPAETTRFLKKEKDRFDNPVAYQITQGIKGLFEAFLQEMDSDQVLGFLDEIIRIRAIQEFSPSQAMAFVFLLKKVIREQLETELQEDHLAAECLELESKIDGLALLGFEVYMKRREKLHEIRINEVKNRISGYMRKAGLTLIYPEKDTDIKH